MDPASVVITEEVYEQFFRDSGETYASVLGQRLTLVGKTGKEDFVISGVLEGDSRPSMPIDMLVRFENHEKFPHGNQYGSPAMVYQPPVADSRSSGTRW